VASRVVISIDLGTTGCRATAFDEDGARAGMHHVEYGLTHPEPGAAEQEAEGWWSAARACIKQIVDGLDDPSCVEAIGISAQGHSWVPTNEEFRPLRPAITWLDTRAAPIAHELLRAKGAHFWGALAGKVPGPWHTLPQLLWLREKEPEIEKRAQHFLYAHDFLVARLTGAAVTDYTTAAASLLYDIEEFGWSRSAALAHRVDLNRLSEARPAGSVAGPLCKEAARDLGLPSTVLVAVGAQDQKCAALGAGLEDRVATVSLGTATAITALSKRPVFDEALSIPCFPYLAERTWVLEAPLTTTGGALRWLRDLGRDFGADHLSFNDLTDMAAGSPPGSMGVRFFPFLAGAGAPHWISGSKAAFVGLGLDSGPRDMARALLEAVAFEIRTNVEAMQAQGVRIDRLRLFGGGARSDLWAQIITDVVGMPLQRCLDVETAALGGAILAMMAAGVCRSLEDGQLRLTSGYEQFEPQRKTPYEVIYQEYCELRELYWRLDAARQGPREA